MTNELNFEVDGYTYGGFRLSVSRAIVVTGPGVMHYRVTRAMLASGMLVEGGYQVMDEDHTVVLVPKDGVGTVEILQRLAMEIKTRIDSGEVKP